MNQNLNRNRDEAESRTTSFNLTKLLVNVRIGDVLVIWKLDRLARSLKNLNEIVSELVQREVGLKSFNDPIDTIISHGQLTFKTVRGPG